MTTAENLLKRMNRDLITVPPETTLHEALTLMTAKRIGSILVRKGDRIVGIWTERDLMRDVLEDGFDPRKTTVGDRMTSELRAAPYDATLEQLQDRFLGLRLRHLLIERDGEYIGMLSSGDVTRADLTTRDRELKRLNKLVGWEYYENWKWDSK